MVIGCGSHGTTTKGKKRGEKAGHAQNTLPDRIASGHVTLSLPVKKAPTRADMAPLPVAHAQNILPDT
jgi:hypothetical protein